MVISLHCFYNHGKGEISGREDMVKKSGLHNIQEEKQEEPEESGLQCCLKSKRLATQGFQPGPAFYTSTSFYSNVESINRLNLCIG